MAVSVSNVDLMERVRNLTNKIYREILYITRHESTKYITMAGLDVPVNAFPWTLHRGIAVSWDLLDYLTMEGEIPCSFTNFITTSKLSGALYINLVCGPMLCTAVRGLSFFCNIYIRIYIINKNEIYKYIYTSHRLDPRFARVVGAFGLSHIRISHIRIIYVGNYLLRG